MLWRMSIYDKWGYDNKINGSNNKSNKFLD